MISQIANQIKEILERTYKRNQTFLIVSQSFQEIQDREEHRRFISSHTLKFTTLLGENRCATTKSNDREEVGFLSILPYDFSLDSDKITSDLLMEGRERQRRIQRNKEILQGVFG